MLTHFPPDQKSIIASLYFQQKRKNKLAHLMMKFKIHKRPYLLVLPVITFNLITHPDHNPEHHMLVDSLSIIHKVKVDQILHLLVKHGLNLVSTLVIVCNLEITAINRLFLAVPSSPEVDQ